MEENFIVNDHVTINKFRFADNQIYQFRKFGELHDYRKFKGEIEGEKVKGYVCLKDDNIYKLELDKAEEVKKWR